ncbi:MAG: right-handed parallel beta-helix repeat-containing protein, partial [Bacteroidales bacterium]|nr:right-handed parallel beta-helix repeat-containing protein [Bacteroidales bacterium]
FNSLKVAGIYFRSERNMEAGKEKHIRDVLVDSCYITRTGKFGIWSQHGGGLSGIGNDSINRNMNLVFRNNHFFETGGSGITPGRSYNCLLEYNTFEYTGSSADPRMAKRGSGAWFWNCRNVVAQFNRSLHVRGPADSYGMHIDFSNKNVILQYNYSEDSEGGFVEILGNNVNSVYRFNVSVNDGIRDNKGNSIWVSTYAGGNNRIASDSNYIYNNTIYAGNGLTPNIYIEGKNTFIYNNIFYTAHDAVIGEATDVIISPGSTLEMSNNLFFGTINGSFSSLDEAPDFSDPLLSDPGEQAPGGYTLLPDSPALSVGKTFEEPGFPMAGKGIFKDVTAYPERDFFGNAVD